MDFLYEQRFQSRSPRIEDEKQKLPASEEESNTQPAQRAMSQRAINRPRLPAPAVLC